MNGDQDRILLRQATTVIYPDNLPVSQVIPEIKKIVAANQVVIICGETGSGKTTQLPKMLFEMGYADNGLIGHTQPRRVAAKTITRRIGEELKTPELVGYKIRFLDKTKENTCIKLMTDGILLQEIQSSKYLRQYSALIIDEAHERSLNIDFILGYLKTILNKRPDLKIIITSATIDNNKLAKFFNNAPIIDVEGKTYPVDIIYQPLNSEAENIDLNQAIYMAIKSCFAIERGNVLVFLPGEREIRECINFLKKSTLRNYQVLSLFSRQNEIEQNRVFIDDGQLKIIVTTNVAETSLTIPGIRFVIDSGLARIKRYNSRNKVEQLQIENISKASSKQRAGRAGRLSHGMCIRLFSELEFNSRPEFTDPELLRSNLANVILKLISFNLGEPENFPFLDVPDGKSFADGFKTLFQLQALIEDKTITLLGRKISQIPIDCNLARILIAGAEFNCLNEILIIVSYLAVNDPRDYPQEWQQLARERHQIWADKQSDFIAILNLWDWYRNELVHKRSRAKLVENCRHNFVSSLRLRDWHELHGQLKEVAHNNGLVESNTPAKYQQIHQALLTGLLNNIGQKDLIESFYLGGNSKKFLLHPNSPIDKAKWVVSASLTQTTKLYARTNAYIEPAWIVPLATHLVKYTYANEHWDKDRGEVIATESTLLTGLILLKKKVSISELNPRLARELFIKQGLVTGELLKSYSWLKHNNTVISNLEKLEDKLRSSLLIMEDELFIFYDKVLPNDICDIRSFDVWCKTNEDSLRLNQVEFLDQFNQETSQVNLYPDTIVSGTEKIKLKYIFNPDSKEDGVTAVIYLNQLNRLNINTFSWLVPGLIRDKLNYIIKGLPKTIRLKLNPVNDFITNFLDANNDYTVDLATKLAKYIQEAKQIDVTIYDISSIQLPAYLVFHFEIIDNRKLITNGSDLVTLKTELSPKVNHLVGSLSTKYEIPNIVGWIDQLTALFKEVKLKRYNHEVIGYISLLVKDSMVDLTVVDELEIAKNNSKKGLFWLIKYQLASQIKYVEQKQLSNFKQITLYLADIYSKDKLLKDSINQILLMSIDLELFPLSEIQFDKLVSESWDRFMPNTVLLATALFDLAKLYHQVKLKLKSHPLLTTIEIQLDDLVYPDFLRYVKYSNLECFPRYLQAILVRLDKYMINPKRDGQLEAEINLLYEAWYNYVDQLEAAKQLVSLEIYNFKYKIEELRVSLFAQELKTPYPVSAKRLWRELEEFAGFKKLSK